MRVGEQVMSEQTIYQKLACIKKTGHTFIIKPFEQILDVQDKGDLITVTLKYFVLEERRGGWLVRETGVKLIGFVKQKSGTWTKTPICAPDEEPDYDFVRTYGASVTPALHRDRIDWATLCYRP